MTGALSSFGYLTRNGFGKGIVNYRAAGLSWYRNAPLANSHAQVSHPS
jgi:hypothetical protein